MDSVAGLSEPASPIPKPNRYCRRRFALAMLGVLLLVITLLLTLASRPGPPFAWLTQAEMARLTYPGPLTRLKEKVIILTLPIWMRYWNTQPQILVDSSLLTLSTAAVEQTGLGTPVATNGNGMRAWVLPPTELKALRQRLNVLPGASSGSHLRIHAVSGMGVEAYTGRTTPMAGTNTPVGVTVHLIPKFVSSSVELTLAATSTEIGALSGRAEAVRTNLGVACRVLLPNAGGLVVDGGNARDASGQSRWLIISPTAVDARGNPIKP
jgi:hypothetical protein